MRFVRMKAAWLFLFICVFYSAWMTGLTFRFSECETLPNYAMLADGFADGHLFIQASPPADMIIKNGNRYIFSGPVPALVRLPVRFLFGTSVPSGVMIILYCAGVGTLFAFILDELVPGNPTRSPSLLKKGLVSVFIANGISLYMVTIPSIHHESISAAMFFLMTALLLLLKAHNDRYRPNAGTAVMIGLSLSFSVGCRFSYAYAAALIFFALVFGYWKHSYHSAKPKVVRAVMITGSIGMASLCLLLWYNAARFGSIWDFGMANLESRYQVYFLNGGYFRYDHFPHNLWSLFFRIPQFVPEFPFVKLPAYILQIRSIGIGPYFLVNANELTISVFFLAPILVLAFVPCLSSKSYGNDGLTPFVILLGLVIVQIFSVGFTVATIARYYYDFIPLMMMMAFMATVHLKLNRKISNGMIAFLCCISTVLSFALPMNAIRLYDKFIDYQSPLLNIFF
ncbi:MAG: hypothetical protein AB1427_06770 [Thermodesulfobacteriota bacterium]